MKRNRIRVKYKYLNLFMSFAVKAAQQSTSCKRKVGAVIVKDNNCISIGWNGTLPGHDNHCEDCNGRTKTDVVHAEENATGHLSRFTGGADNGSIFVTTAPCFVCSRLIIKAGIKEVYFLDEYKNQDGIQNLIKSNLVVIKMEFDKDRQIYVIDRVINKGDS